MPLEDSFTRNPTSAWPEPSPKTFSFDIEFKQVTSSVNKVEDEWNRELDAALAKEKQVYESNVKRIKQHHEARVNKLRQTMITQLRQVAPSVDSTVSAADVPPPAPPRRRTSSATTKGFVLTAM